MRHLYQSPAPPALSCQYIPHSHLSLAVQVPLCAVIIHVSDLLVSAPHLLIAIQLLRWMSTKVGITDFCSSSLLRCLQIVLSFNTWVVFVWFIISYTPRHLMLPSSSSYASFLVILCCLCVFILCFLLLCVPILLTRLHLCYLYHTCPLPYTLCYHLNFVIDYLANIEQCYCV
jgi:hypothetical protein